MNVTEIKACRACQDGNLTTVLNLGNLAVSDFVDDPVAVLDKAPLELVRCGGCGLVQLRHTVDRDRLYRQYHYRSGVNETMVAALRDVVEDARQRVTVGPGDWVMDIGCNDGTLLDQYPRGVNLIGFEPSQLWESAVRSSAQRRVVIHDYFPPTRYPVDPVPCKIITAVACFYDLDDPGLFLGEVKRWLHPEGVLVLQFQDLASMVSANAVDNIAHEHLTYWTTTSLSSLLRRHDLKIVGVLGVEVNGGSMRYTVKHAAAADHYPADFPGWVDHDRKMWAGVYPTLEQFSWEVEMERARCVALLRRLKAEGKTVHGIAASTKFNTLSQYYGIGPDLITAIGERSPAKVGTYTVTGIPIVSEETLRAARPDYLFVCAWQFADAFLKRESVLLKHGTKFIVPLPQLRVVGGDEVADLQPSNAA